MSPPWESKNILNFITDRLSFKLVNNRQPLRFQEFYVVVLNSINLEAKIWKCCDHFAKEIFYGSYWSCYEGNCRCLRSSVCRDFFFFPELAFDEDNEWVSEWEKNAGVWVFFFSQDNTGRHEITAESSVFTWNSLS